MELYSRQLIGWAVDSRTETKLVYDALQMAWWRREHPKGVIVHSDRGSQYCAHQYQQLLPLNHLQCSMGKRSGCYDNAAKESWHHSFKVEAIHGEKFRTRQSATLVVHLNTSMSTTIESAFILILTIKVRSGLKKNVSLSDLSEKTGEDQS